MPRQIQSAVVNLGSMNDFRYQVYGKIRHVFSYSGKYKAILDK